MKDIVFKLPKETEKFEDIEIIPLSDLHIGDAQCNYKAILDRIKYIKETPNVYCLLNGDLMNNAISTSDPFAEEFTPMGQVKKVCELFGDIKDKIISITSGNHENRTYKVSGIDISYMYALEMGIANRYTNEGALVFLECGSESRGRIRNGKVRGVSYVIYHSHGTGGGKMIGGKLNRLEYLSGICDADIYIMGHTHLPATFKEGYIRVDPRNHTHANITKLFVNTSATLEFGGYGERFGFKPSSMDTPSIILGNHKKWYKAIL